MDHHSHSMMNATVMNQNMTMNHSSVDHSTMDHGTMDHSSMNHSTMNMSSMVNCVMNCSTMDHSSMDHSSMDHSSMDHSSMDHSGDHMNMDMGMQMYFHDGYSEYVLFKSCYTESVGAMVGACFVIFFLAILYEGLKFLRESVLQKSIAAKPGGAASYSVDKLPAGSSQEHMVMEMRNPSIATRMLTGNHFLQTFLHVVQVFISYCLMLVFMTYNVWLCLSVILGAGTGYFLFGWKRAMVLDSNEHCH